MRLGKPHRRVSKFGRQFWPSSSFFAVRLNAAKITLLFAIIGVIVLMVLDHRNQQFALSVRSFIVDTTLPLIDMSVDVTKTVTHEIRDLFSPYKKYERQLAEKDETIQFWKLEVQRLRHEMQQLRTALNFKNDLKLYAFTTQLLIPKGHQSKHKGFLNLGSKSGLSKDSVVISRSGLVGKVTQVGTKTAEVILLHHPLSAVPVYVERTQALGVVKGDVRQGILLEYVDGESIKDGDRLLTSGQGGVFPRGINVAVVRKTSKGVLIQPTHDIDTTTLVYVLSPHEPELPSHD